MGADSSQEDRARQDKTFDQYVMRGTALALQLGQELLSLREERTASLATLSLTDLPGE